MSMCSRSKSSRSWPCFVVDESPRMLSVPMAKRVGVVEPLLLCRIDSDGKVIKCKQVMYWLDCPPGGASEHVGAYTLVPCAGRALGPSPRAGPPHNFAGRAWAYILRALG